MRIERNASSHPDPARLRNRLLAHLWNSSLPRQVAARLGPFPPEMPDAGDRQSCALLRGTGLRIGGNPLRPPFPALPLGSTKTRRVLFRQNKAAQNACRTGIELVICCIMDFGRGEAVEPLDSTGPISRVPIGTIRVDRVPRAWRPR